MHLCDFLKPDSIKFYNVVIDKLQQWRKVIP